MNVNGNGIESVFLVGSKLDAKWLKFLHEDLGHKSALLGNLSETMSSMPLHVEGGHVGKESLSSTDVTSSLISSDMLLSGLHCHSESLVTVGIFGDTNDSTWHLSLELV